MTDDKKDLIQILKRALLKKAVPPNDDETIENLQATVESVADALNQQPPPKIGTLQGKATSTADWTDLCSIPSLESAYSVIERLEKHSGKGVYQVVDLQGNVIAPKPD